MRCLSAAACPRRRTVRLIVTPPPLHDRAAPATDAAPASTTSASPGCGTNSRSPAPRLPRPPHRHAQPTTAHRSSSTSRDCAPRARRCPTSRSTRSPEPANAARVARIPAPIASRCRARWSSRCRGHHEADRHAGRARDRFPAREPADADRTETAMWRQRVSCGGQFACAENRESRRVNRGLRRQRHGHGRPTRSRDPAGATPPRSSSQAPSGRSLPDRASTSDSSDRHSRRTRSFP